MPEYGVPAVSGVRGRMLELFVSPDCPHCKRALKRVNRQLPADRQITKTSVIEHIDRAVELGIRRVPALVAGEQIICQGTLSEQRWVEVLSAETGIPCPE